VSVCCTVSEESKRRQKGFQIHQFLFQLRQRVIPHVGSDNAASLRVLPRLPSYWKVSNNSHTTATTLEDLTWCCEDCQKNWASCQDGKDWRICHGFQNCEEMNQEMTLKMRNHYSCGLARCHCSINCSSTFVRIDFLLPFEFIYQHLPDSRLSAWLRQNPCNHRFLGGIIQTRDVMSWWGPQPFQLNNCKNRVRKLVSKRREESVKELVIDHFIARTSSEWQMIGIVWQNRDIAKEADLRRG